MKDEQSKDDLLDILEQLGLKATIIDGSDPNSLDKMKDILKGKLNHDRNLENPSKIYPSISLEEGKMYLEIMKKLGDSKFDESDVVQWVRYIGHSITHVKEFPGLVHKLKELIHVVNRTTCIMTTLEIGIMIGLFLGRPDLVPVLDNKEEEEI